MNEAATYLAKYVAHKEKRQMKILMRDKLFHCACGCFSAGVMVTIIAFKLGLLR